MPKRAPKVQKFQLHFTHLIGSFNPKETYGEATPAEPSLAQRAHHALLNHQKEQAPIQTAPLHVR